MNSRIWEIRPVKQPIHAAEALWWGVTLITELYYVKGTQEDEVLDVAQADVKARHGSISPIFNVRIMPEDVQVVLDERYSDKTIVRAIPNSIVEFPDSISTMTEEQRQALYTI